MSLCAPFGKNLPRAYGGCGCICHRQEGVMHVMACCGPKDEENPAFYITEGIDGKNNDNKEECDKV
jgi:hypothetical protein